METLETLGTWGGGLAAATLATDLEELDERVLTQEMRSPEKRMEEPELGIMPMAPGHQNPEQPNPNLVPPNQNPEPRGHTKPEEPRVVHYHYHYHYEYCCQETAHAHHGHDDGEQGHHRRHGRPGNGHDDHDHDHRMPRTRPTVIRLRGN